MKSKAIQSANIHAATTHAKAKADAVEGRPPLTFDGCGINGPDEYRTRLATFQDREQGKAWGPLLAAAPEMMEAIEAEILHLQYDIGEARCNADADELDARVQRLRAVLLKAKGSL